MDGTVILAGDVGGTKTYLALYSATGSDFEPVAEARYATPDYPSLGALLQAFVQETGRQPVASSWPCPVRCASYRCAPSICPG